MTIKVDRVSVSKDAGSKSTEVHISLEDPKNKNLWISDRYESSLGADEALAEGQRKAQAMADAMNRAKAEATRGANQPSGRSGFQADLDRYYSDRPQRKRS